MYHQQNLYLRPAISNIWLTYACSLHGSGFVYLGFWCIIHIVWTTSAVRCHFACVHFFRLRRPNHNANVSNTIYSICLQFVFTCKQPTQRPDSHWLQLQLVGKIDERSATPAIASTNGIWWGTSVRSSSRCFWGYAQRVDVCERRECLLAALRLSPAFLKSLNVANVAETNSFLISCSVLLMLDAIRLWAQKSMLFQ